MKPLTHIELNTVNAMINLAERQGDTRLASRLRVFRTERRPPSRHPNKYPTISAQELAALARRSVPNALPRRHR